MKKKFSQNHNLFHENRVLLLFIIFIAAIIVAAVAIAYNEAFFWGTLIATDRFIHDPRMVFIAVPLFFLVAAFLCKKFSPNAAGSGPEHVLSAIKKLSDDNKADVKEYLGFRVLIVKILSSIICIAGGGALGREGPVVQISASVFYLVALRIKNIFPSLDLRTWIVAGSAAGVAAAFNAPLAGIIFAVEELSDFKLERKFSLFKIKAFFAVIIAGVAAQLMTGSYTLFGFKAMHFTWDFHIAAVLLIIATTCGIVAFIFKKITVFLCNLGNKLQGIKWYLVPLIAGFVVATISYFVGVHSFGAGILTIKEALESQNAILGISDTVGRFMNVIFSFASGSAGGLLLPGLAVGAGIGSIWSVLYEQIDARIFVASGMAAFLGALINAPLTAAVLVLEVTDQKELILPLFLSTLVATSVLQSANNRFKI